jgi:hypothetical protein
MAGKRRSRKPQEARTAPPPGTFQVAVPRKKLKALFELVIDVCRTAEHALFTMSVQDPARKQFVQFDGTFLIRGSNALKAIRLLCEEAHWEFAASAVRQLFELVLNAEHIARDPDREAAMLRYAKFGLLQMVREQQATLTYERVTGRSIDLERLRVLDSMLERSFPEFRHVGSTGHVTWDKTWSGLDARRLAALSPRRIRPHQYTLLFSTWSEQAHAAPGALIDDLMRNQIDVDRILATDEVRIAETIGTAVSLFLELWALLPNVPAVNAQQQHAWLSSLVKSAEKYGATAWDWPAEGQADQSDTV